jgi:hypothetical protein
MGQVRAGSGKICKLVASCLRAWADTAGALARGALPIAGGPYEAFAGRECARALALMKIDPSECNANLEGLEEKHLKTLDDWHKKFSTKYKIVGKVQ